MLKWEDKIGGLGWIGKEREWGDGHGREGGEEDLFYSERKSNG